MLRCIQHLFRCRFGLRLRGVSQVRSTPRSVAFRSVALLCLLLTFWSAQAVAAHHHNNNTESKCTVCVAAHSTAPTTASCLLKATFSAVFTLKTEPASAKQHFVAFALSVRPPPAA